MEITKTVVAAVTVIALFVAPAAGDESKVTCALARSLTSSGLCVTARENSDCRLVSGAHPECVVLPQEEWQTCAGLAVEAARPACFRDTCDTYCDAAHCEGKLRAGSIFAKWFNRRWSKDQCTSACAACRAAEKVEASR